MFLAGVHLNLVLTFVSLFALLYSAINSRIPFAVMALAVLSGIAFFTSTHCLFSVFMVISERLAKN